jgi:hypothetical protein
VGVVAIGPASKEKSPTFAGQYTTPPSPSPSNLLWRGGFSRQEISWQTHPEALFASRTRVFEQTSRLWMSSNVQIGLISSFSGQDALEEALNGLGGKIFAESDEKRWRQRYILVAGPTIPRKPNITNARLCRVLVFPDSISPDVHLRKYPSPKRNKKWNPSSV